MDVELITLGFLMSGPKSGYRLQSIAQNMMLLYRVTLNQVYPALRKLEKAGYIQKEVVFQTGKPNKNVLSLTDSGRRHFFERIQGKPEPLEVEIPFLVKSLFFRFLSPEEAAHELSRQVQALSEQLAELEAAGPAAMAHGDEHGRFIFRTAVHMVRALRDWYQAEYQRRTAAMNPRPTQHENITEP